MPTAAENLETSINNTLARIAEVTATVGPDYTENGRTISKGTYLTQLHGTLKELIALRGKVGGSFLVKSYGRS